MARALSCFVVEEYAQAMRIPRFRRGRNGMGGPRRCSTKLRTSESFVASHAASTVLLPTMLGTLGKDRITSSDQHRQHWFVSQYFVASYGNVCVLLGAKMLKPTFLVPLTMVNMILAAIVYRQPQEDEVSTCRAYIHAVMLLIWSSRSLEVGSSWLVGICLRCHF